MRFMPLACAEELSLEPKSGVLLLKNQQVLAGNITRLGDYYHLLLGNSGEVRIAKNDVQFQGTNLEDVYAHKVTVMPGRSCDAHLNLADWCIRQKLFPQAAEQIVKAMAIRPEDKRIAAMEERLKVASQPPPDKKALLETSAATVSREQLERTSHELPTGSLERFTIVVQPILMDRCGAARCHGNADTSFQVVQPSQTRVPSRRFTQRNLFATLALVNRESPAESPLLKFAREPHGGRQDAPFAREEDRQYQELVDWINGLGQNQRARLERPQTVSMRQLAGPQRQVGQIPESLDDEPDTALPSQPASPESAVRDPFDPELFNRRFFPR